MKLLGKRRKLGNQGLSLVELLCSIAILGMLAMVVSSVLVVSANSYRRENADTDAQQEAQLVANQITDLLIDSSTNGAATQVDFASGRLTITQGDALWYEVVHDAEHMKLNLTQQKLVADVWKVETQVMAENVKEFSVDTSQFDETGNISVKIVYMKGTEEYPAVFNVTARNKENTTGTIATVNLSVPSEIVQEPGQSCYRFEPQISGGTGTLSYACEGNTDTNTKVLVEADGKVRVMVGNLETANMFRIKVTAAVTGASGTTSHINRYVRVYVRRATTVKVTGTLNGGSPFQWGARYGLQASVDGNYMEQRVGEDYDTSDPSDPNHYVDPKKVYHEWVVASNMTPGTSWHWDNVNDNAGTRTLVLDGNMQDGEIITVTAKAAHPLGTNKSGSLYYPAAKGYWVLSKTDAALNQDGGWLRLTNDAQASVNGPKVQGLKATLGGTRHVIEVRFREYPDGNYDSPVYCYGGVSVGSGGWLRNIYGGDADDSMSVNIRPLLTRVMDYRKDYEIQIRLSIVDDAGNKVWPTDTTPESEYMVGNIMQRVGVSFKSNLLAFSDAYKTSEGSSPSINMSKGNQVQNVLEMDRVQGVVRANEFENGFVFIAEKKIGGVWVSVPASEGINCQNQQGRMALKFDGDNFGGDYRVKVEVSGMPSSKLVGTVMTDLPNITYKLWDEATGQGIFYFHVNKVNW